MVQVSIQWLEDSVGQMGSTGDLLDQSESKLGSTEFKLGRAYEKRTQSSSSQRLRSKLRAIGEEKREPDITSEAPLITDIIPADGLLFIIAVLIKTFQRYIDFTINFIN